MLREIFALIVGEHGVFLGIEDDGIGGEIEADFFP